MFVGMNSLSAYLPFLYGWDYSFGLDMQKSSFCYTKSPDDNVIEKLIREYEDNPTLLKTGPKPADFPLLPREILVNWLLCVPLVHVAKHSCVMVADDREDGTDGGLLDQTTGLTHFFQHVYVPTHETPRGVVQKINGLVVSKFQLKARKGIGYAEGIELVIFSDAVGLVEPTEINKLIEGVHGFKSVYVLAIEKKDKDGYHYWLTVLDSPRKYFTFRIIVPYDCSFRNCKVVQTY